MAREDYEAQFSLLVRVLPQVAKEDIFALKGGSAINIFYRNLPRLSVDIDLTYLPRKERSESLVEIDNAMNRIALNIEGNIAGAQAQRIRGHGDSNRIQVRLDEASIKIEVSPVARGVVHEPRVMSIAKAVEDEFGSAEMQVVSFEDLFGGKLHATLDRQHPRDLYDVKLLYENEGLTDDLFRTFLVYVASSSRPSHELLSPNLVALDEFYVREFEGMTKMPVSLEELRESRSRLIADIQSRFDKGSIEFLLSLHDGNPDFAAIDRPQAADLPAVRWKLLNLNKLKTDNPDKHAAQRENLVKVLGAAPV